MKKRLCFSWIWLCILLIPVILLTACGNPQNGIDTSAQNITGNNPQNAVDNNTPKIDIDQERIGSEYTVSEGQKPAANDFHGSVKNYNSTLQDNLWTVIFDAMNSTAYRRLEIDPRDTLKVKSKLISGTVWVKITQGDLSKSALHKVQSVYDETLTIDLSQWEPGEIAVWLVVENGESGMIRVEQDFYAQNYVTSLSYTHITEESWQSPEEIEVPNLLNCVLDMTVKERVGSKGFLQKDQKLHVPAEVIEPLVYRYFNLSENYLRSSSCYVAQEKGYVFNSGPVGSLFLEIDKISRQDRIATVEFHYYDYPTGKILKKVTLKVDESRENNEYLSCKVSDPTPTDQEAAAARNPEIFPQGFGADWSFTGKPQGEDFKAGRDIFGLEFSLTYDAVSGKYVFKPGMGDCSGLISYTLTGNDFTVVLNGKGKLLYPNIPAIVRINKYVTDDGYEGRKDSYKMKTTDITTGADGNYYLKVPFDWPYPKGEITYVDFTFGKLD